MASEVTPDGHVIAPLNISAPAPVVNLKGFDFGTVDEKILGSQHRSQQVFKRVEATSITTPATTTAVPTPAPPLFPLAKLQGVYAGNGFNTIFRPRASNFNPFPIQVAESEDNVLELNLTTEQWTFGATIGEIPNRGLFLNGQPDINLQGFPYLQTVQDVTNPETGKGDNVQATSIHFETGMWLNVPASSNPKNAASVVRMASIPHGTTINAQCLSPISNPKTPNRGTAGPPNFNAAENTLDTTPFSIKDKTQKQSFPSMTAATQGTPRIPQNLDKFVAAKTITDPIIKNPNLVLQNAIQGQDIAETITFEVSTAPPNATLSGGGTTNISFLTGKQDPATTAASNTNGTVNIKGTPNADAAFMKSKFWIETVNYQVDVPILTTNTTFTLKPTMPKGSTAPTPQFLITPPASLPTKAQTIKIQGTQIQYSQTVNLNFGPLTWPHVSVATLVPTAPQPFQMT